MKPLNRLTYLAWRVRWTFRPGSHGQIALRALAYLVAGSLVALAAWLSIVIFVAAFGR